MSTQRADRDTASGSASQDTLVRRRPVLVFLLFALGLGWPILGLALLAGIPIVPVPLLLVMFGALLPAALVVTRRADGPGAVRRLLRRTLLWRFGLARWAVVLFAVPVLTMAFAAVSGTLGTPEDGWAREIGVYLFSTLVIGLLVLNLWEELVWSGFMQSRLMAHRGLLVGSLVTALFFAAIHVPLTLEANDGWTDVAVSLGVLFGMAPVYRYLLGMHLLDTGGSILAVGVQHASWNASQSLGSVDGGTTDWQALAAVATLTALVALERRRRTRRSTSDLDSEKAAAAGWVGSPGADSTSGRLSTS
jgi:membrane protease YdiL (CAAX protease family)